jgi:glycosyltransferase involved in cell wall biosynthesis
MEASSHKPLRILLSSYACEPGRGSEPGVGWNTAREIAKHHQVWVLTANAHRAKIEAELDNRPIPNLHVVYLDPFGWVFDWSQEGKRLPIDVQLHYYLWQIWAYFIGRRLHEEIHFDLVHHVTYVKYFTPSFLAFLPIPFIWGPVGGGESAPKAFDLGISKKGLIYEFFRNTARRLGELDPFVHLTARRSRLAWATTEDTAKRLVRIGAKNVKVLTQVGLNEEELDTLNEYAAIDTPSFRLISVGRLLHWKGFHLGLQAFARANLPESAEYWIVGEGSESQFLQELAQKLQIAHRVKFLSLLPREETLQKLGESFVLIHPSLHDSGGLVCLEAMAAGCPVICLDLGGPGVQITSDVGFKISAHTPEQVVRDIAEAMSQLVRDPELRRNMGAAGQKRVRHYFSWQNKSELMIKTYQEL